MRRCLMNCTLSLVGLAFVASVATAQAASKARQGESTELRLPSPDVVFAEDFSVVSSVRELTDGRVLVSDEKEGRLVLIDVRARSAITIGSRGAGPGEYRQVARLWAISGDSTFHKEPFGPRLIILHGGQIIRTIGPSDPSLQAITTAPLLGVDGRGGMVVTKPARDAAG